MENISKHIFLTVFLIVSISSLAEMAEASIGRIGLTNGTVTHLSEGVKDSKENWVKAKKGFILEEGDSVKTGVKSKALLTFVDGSKMVMGENSSLTISKFLIRKKKERSILFGLDVGTVRTFVNKFFGKSSVSVKTKSVTAGVKGTEFVTVSKGDSTMIFGTESEVSVTTSNGTEEVTVGPRQMAQGNSVGEPSDVYSTIEDKELSKAKSLLDNLTDVDVPTDWDEAGKVGDIVARWNINKSKLLMDKKSFDKALVLLKTSFDFADDNNIKADSLNLSALIKSTFTNDLAGALIDFEKIINTFEDTEAFEAALFNGGRVALSLGDKVKAKQYLEQYLVKYPQGKFKMTASTLIETIK